MTFSYIYVYMYILIYIFLHMYVRTRVRAICMGVMKRRRSSRLTVEPSVQCFRGCCGDARGNVLTLRLGVGINYSYFVGASEQGTCQPTIPTVRPGGNHLNPHNSGSGCNISSVSFHRCSAMAQR